MLAVASLISAVCMGVLAGSARTPRVRPVPACASTVLILILAYALAFADPGNLLLSYSCLVLFVIAMATYSALTWRAVLGKEQIPFMTAFGYSFIGEKHLRARYAGLKEAEVARTET
ncbi:hypothetical protein [Microbacterium sp. NPDC057650]|uniref:hypothetical protein n=1 Tax=unclassified Microbacterium TaxID=2609290 RepID=UPI003671AD42